MRTHLTIAAVAAAVATLILSGCGSDDDQPVAIETPSGPSCSETITTANPAPPAETTEQGRKVETLNPTTVCDQAIEIVDGKATCTEMVGSYMLTIDSPNNKGWLNDPVSARTYDAFTRIEWDSMGAHALIVNGERWGYVDGVGLGGKTGPMALATLLYNENWGGMVTGEDTVQVCGWGL